MIRPFQPKTDIQPYYVSTLDIETASTGDVLAIGMQWQNVDGEREYHVYDTWDAWYTDMMQRMRDADAAQRRRLSTIYAHNGAGFDWLSLIVWAERNDLLERMRFITAGSFGIGIDITFERHVMRLRDSIRLLPGSLASLCASFGVMHQKQDTATPYITHMETMLERHPDTFYEYLRHDVFALSDVLYAFWSLIYEQVGSIGELPLTLPALSMKLWRMHLPETIMTTTNDADRAFERRAYTGGRTECYDAVVADDVRIYDANSLYPTVMHDEIYPASYAGGHVAEYTGQHGIYEIRYVQHDRSVKPVLRDEASNEFRYTGHGVYVQPEIEELIRRGGEITCVRGYVYDEMASLFQPFVERWYGIREQAKRDGDDGLAFVCKILMNSLYGKFGQRDEGEVIYWWDETELQDQLLKIERGDPDAKICIVEKGDFSVVTEKRFSETTFVGIAAYITAYARLRLYRQMCDVQEHGGHLYATDTDSVHTGNGYHMETGSGLGEWKEEFHGQAAYLGKKLYALGDGTIKAKGIGRDGRSQLTFDHFRRLIERGDEMSVDFTVMPSIRETLDHTRDACRAFARRRTIRATVKDHEYAD